MTTKAPVMQRVTLALCGGCASALGGILEAGHDVRFGTACEGEHGDAAPAATGLYTCTLEQSEARRLGDNAKPSLELVLVPPATLDDATHAKQALALLAAWGHGGGAEAAASCDAFVVKLAVDAVERVHRAVHNRRA